MIRGFAFVGAIALSACSGLMLDPGGASAGGTDASDANVALDSSTAALDGDVRTGDESRDALDDRSSDVSDAIAPPNDLDAGDAVEPPDVPIDYRVRDSADLDLFEAGSVGDTSADDSLDASDVGPDAVDAGVDAVDAGVDAVDAGSKPRDGGSHPTILKGSFEAIGAASRDGGSLEIRGQFLSPAFVRGGLPNGLKLEGRFH